MYKKTEGKITKRLFEFETGVWPKKWNENDDDYDDDDYDDYVDDYDYYDDD